MHAATARENFLLLHHKKRAVVQNHRALCSQPHKEDHPKCVFFRNTMKEQLSS